MNNQEIKTLKSLLNNIKLLNTDEAIDSIKKIKDMSEFYIADLKSILDKQ